MSNSILMLTTVALAALFAGDAAATGPGTVDHIEPTPLLAAERTDGARDVAFKKLAAGFAAGDFVGTVRKGANCSESAERYWSDLIAQRVEVELREVLREQLAQSSLMTAGQATSIEVIPFVNDLRIDLCSLGRAGWQGEVYVQINWTLSTAEPRRIMYQASTSGVIRQLHPASGSAINGLRQALALAARELLGDGRFVAVLKHPIESSIVATTR